MAAGVLFPSQDRDSDWQCQLLYPVGSKSIQLLGLPTFLLPVSAEQSDTEHATAFPLARRLNPRGNPAGCKNNPAFPTRPPNLAMMDAVVFEVESASSPTSSLCRSGGFVPPVCVLGRGGQVSLSLWEKRPEPVLCHAVGGAGRGQTRVADTGVRGRRLAF